jgi:uncharacterized membrane protein YfcA
MTPYFLLIGLTPQQIVAGASVASLGLGGSSFVAMRGHQLLDKRFLWPLIGLTVAATILAMLVLPRIESGIFEIAGMLLIALLRDIVWGYALASLFGCYLSGFIGTKIALKKGDVFVKYGLAVVMVVSGFLLVIK